MAAMAADLTGTWSLVSWRRVVGDDSVTYPLGEDAAGTLIYAPDGSMGVVLTAAQRPTTLPAGNPLDGAVEDRAQAYSTCLAYVGTWEVRDAEVVHRVTQCLYPGWAGAEQVRPFELDGAQLTLRTPPAAGPNGTVVNELVWQRAR
jgi:hypothetical protein